MNIQKTLLALNALMTQADIADAIGASQASVNRLKSGKHKSCCYERAMMIQKLAAENNILT